MTKVIKQRSQEELDFIRKSWKITDDGIVLWNRKALWKNIGDPVGLSVSKLGYANCFLTINGKYIGYSVKQIAWFLYHNEWPNLEVDHIDNDPTNNKKDNLRLATRSQQSMNRVSGIRGRKNKGVYKRDYGDKWSAQIWFDGKCKNLGTFGSEKEAIEARLIAAKEFHKEFANTKSYMQG
jgi:hypothetical protein